MDKTITLHALTRINLLFCQFARRRERMMAQPTLAARTAVDGVSCAADTTEQRLRWTTSMRAP